MKEEAIKCSKELWTGSNFYSHQCSRNFTVERNGKKYCKTHDPLEVEKRDKKRDAKWDEESCKNCKYHFPYPYHKFCPICGTRRKK